MAQLKENLYSDLTGLIIPNIKRTDEADVYDCIQTGRNGSTYSKIRLNLLVSNSIQTQLTDDDDDH